MRRTGGRFIGCVEVSIDCCDGDGFPSMTRWSIKPQVMPWIKNNQPASIILLLFDKVLLLAAKVQFVVLTSLFLNSRIKATPAILSDSLREIFLRTNASFYEEALWVNATLPDNTPILTDIRSRSLLNTRTVPVEYVHLFKEKDSLSLAILDKMIKKYRVQYVVLSDNTAYCKIKERYAGDTVCGARTFSAGTRNPFNRVTHTTTIYRLRSY